MFSTKKKGCSRQERMFLTAIFNERNRIVDKLETVGAKKFLTVK